MRREERKGSRGVFGSVCLIASIQACFARKRYVTSPVSGGGNKRHFRVAACCLAFTLLPFLLSLDIPFLCLTIDYPLPFVSIWTYNTMETVHKQRVTTQSTNGGCVQRITWCQSSQPGRWMTISFLHKNALFNSIIQVS
jgi:hypothetical protein